MVRAQTDDSVRALVLVTGSSSRVQDLSLGELRQLFLRSVGSDAKGNKLVPLNQPPGSPERELFDRRILGMSPEQMARHWIDQKIRGQPSAPRSFSPPQILARVLERIPDSITYLRPEHVTANLRAVRIDGHAPTHRTMRSERDPATHGPWANGPGKPRKECSTA